MKAFPVQRFQDGVVEALRNPLAPRHFKITRGDADREAHRRGVLECLEAIAAGPVRR
jgi:para-aminobenzoate synthetase component I